ncbi:MAG: pyridoxal phosphate-dependent aminotransferase [Candidatus Nitrosomaritimum aestuariumsis]|jgi:histidinol-phosphate aminotransferase
MSFDIKTKLRDGLQSTQADVGWDFSRNQDLIELQFGEMQEDISKNILSAIKKASQNVHIYTDLLQKFTRTISKYKDIPEDNIVIVNATDKAFRLLAETFITPGDECIIFPPTYPAIKPSINIFQGKIIELGMQSDFNLPTTEDISKHVSKDTKLIYIANPSTPTGNLVTTRKQIVELLQLDIIVIVDECYFEIAKVSMDDLITEFPNLVIIRSLSKTYGLAGLRMGYIIAHPELAGILRFIEYSLEPVPSVTSLAGAIAAIKDEKHLNRNLKRLEKSKKKLIKGFRKLGLIVYDSYTTSVLVDTQNININADEFVYRLRELGVIVKTCQLYGNAEPSWVNFGIPKLEQASDIIQKVKTLIKNVN